METLLKSKKYKEVKISKEPTLFTGKDLFDKWFSSNGGIVIGSAIFVSGNSGAGKTTLMVNLMKWMPQYKISMYSREMASGSVKSQTLGLNINHENAFLSDINDFSCFDDYMNEIENLKPKIVIVDSLQVIAKEDYALKGIMTEERACYDIIKRLREWISKNDAILFLIGHSIKGDEGNFAGTNTILQMVDCDIKMIFNKKENYRTISWGNKNRKGPMGTMYFDINDDEMDFFKTEEEFREQNPTSQSDNCIEVTFEEFLEKQVCSFLQKMKTKPNFKEFKKEYLKKVKVLDKLNEINGYDKITYITENIKLINSCLVEKR